MSEKTFIIKQIDILKRNISSVITPEIKTKIDNEMSTLATQLDTVFESMKNSSQKATQEVQDLRVKTSKLSRDLSRTEKQFNETKKKFELKENNLNSQIEKLEGIESNLTTTLRETKNKLISIEKISKKQEINMNNSNMKLTALEAEVEQVKTSEKNSQREKKTFESKFLKTEQIITQLESKIEKFESVTESKVKNEIEQKKQIKNLQNNVEKSDQKIIFLSTKESQLTQMNENLESKITSTNNKLKDVNQEILTFSQKNEMLQKEQFRLNSEIDKLNDSEKDLTKLKDENIETIRKLEDILKIKTSQGKQVDYNDLDSAMASSRMKSMKSDAIKDLEFQKKQFSTQIDDIKSVEQQNFEDLKIKNIEANKRINELELLISDLKIEINSKIDKIKNLESEAENVNSLYTTEQNKQNLSSNQLAEITAKYELILDKREEVNTLLIEKESQIKQLIQSQEKLELEIKNKANQIESLSKNSDQTNSLAEEVTELRKKSESIQKSNNSLQEKITELQTSIVDLSSDKDMILNEKEDLEKRLNEKDTIISSNVGSDENIDTDQIREELQLKTEQLENIQDQLARVSSLYSDMSTEQSFQDPTAIFSIYVTLVEELYGGKAHSRLLMLLHQKDVWTKTEIAKFSGVTNIAALRAIHELARAGLVTWDENAETVSLIERFLK